MLVAKLCPQPEETLLTCFVVVAVLLVLVLVLVVVVVLLLLAFLVS